MHINRASKDEKGYYVRQSDGYKLYGKIVACECCGTSYFAPNYYLKEGKRNFCSKQCYPTGEKHNRWNGGPKAITTNGYKRVRKIGAYGKDNRAFEHRVVMENNLGRSLQSNEIVHHIDGNKLNNDINNLMVVSRSEHMRIHAQLRKG